MSYSDAEHAGARNSLAFSSYIDGVPVVQFTKVTDYTTFTAEYSADSETGDITYHLYRPEDASYSQAYFERQFADILSAAAVEFFRLEYPRLAAAWTPEANSWWLRARGVGLRGNSSMMSLHFFALLDKMVDEALPSRAKEEALSAR
jgi:hypothetical protein